MQREAACSRGVNCEQNSNKILMQANSGSVRAPQFAHACHLSSASHVKAARKRQHSACTRCCLASGQSTRRHHHRPHHKVSLQIPAADVKKASRTETIVVIGQEKLQLMHIGPSGPIYTTPPLVSARALSDQSLRAREACCRYKCGRMRETESRTAMLGCQSYQPLGSPGCLTHC